MNTTYIPDFLYLSIGFWMLLLFFLIGFCIYLVRLPDDKILDYKAQAIENKRRLKIKIYKF